MNQDSNETLLLEPLTFKRYTCEISPNIYQRIDKLLYLSKHFKGGHLTKQDWILEAFKDKLESDKELSPDTIPKTTVIHFKIDERTLKKMEEKIELIKKFRRSYSKKQWFMEAILEKLSKDEVNIKKQLEGLK